MGVCVRDLDAHQIERLRAAVAELLALRFAYPPFFDYASGSARIRPADRQKRQQIAHFINSVTFDTLAQVDIAAPEMRRFIERMVLSFIEINPALTRPHLARRVPEMRSWVPKASAEMQRAVLAAVLSDDDGSGALPAAEPWQPTAHRSPYANEDGGERNTAVLVAALGRGQAGSATKPSDLNQVYGEYLQDMHPGERSAESSVPTPPTPVPPIGPDAQAPAPGRYDPPAPKTTTALPAAASESGDARSDSLIFAQLRYQLEAYVRRAARSYGLPQRDGDPARVLDALRRSGMVDEADLRIVEGILALTDRVRAQARASVEDYRQGLLLYLLYHRSHLGA